MTENMPAHEESSGNVFADLGLPNAEEELLKAQLTLRIYRAIRDRGLTQVQAAALLGLRQPQVSLLMRNRPGGFSVGRLMRLLAILGQDIEITVRPAPAERGQGRIALVAAE
jgi:predicted XRE-type DNA-binding protein